MFASNFSRLVSPAVVYEPVQFPRTVREALAEEQLLHELRTLRATVESLARQARYAWPARSPATDGSRRS
jgi:hypothetical protein